ncbi:MAG: hypothetical protein WC122_04150 [archaeon]
MIILLFFLINNVFAACASGHSCSILTVANTACFNNNPYDCRYMGGISYCYVQNDICSSKEICVDSLTTEAHCECKVTDEEDSYSCYSNDVYWYDNCGGRQSKKSECNHGTTYSSNYCYGGNVVRDKVVKGCLNSSCTSSSSKEVMDYCSSSEICSNAKCIVDCSPTNYSKSCYDNDVYWYDKCGARQSKYDECGSDSVSLAYCEGRSIYKNSIDNGCSSGSCFSNSSKVLQSTCEDYEYCSSAKCYNGSISSVSWSKSSVWEGEMVTLTANVSNIANGVKIKFYIFESDAFFNDELATVYANVSNGKATYDYTIPDLDDGWGAP